MGTNRWYSYNRLDYTVIMDNVVIDNTVTIDGYHVCIYAYTHMCIIYYS